MYYCKFILHVCTRTRVHKLYFDEEPVGTSTLVQCAHRVPGTAGPSFYK